MAKVYLFRKILNTDDAQAEVYQEAITALVELVLNGCAGTIFNYGDCSSYDYEKADSKGTNGDKQENIVLGVIHELFNKVYKMELTMEINISIKYHELCVEKQNYLTDFEDCHTADTEDSAKKHSMKNLKEHFVSMPKDVFSYITKRIKQLSEECNQSTKMHSLFVISVRQTNLAKSKKLTGKLNLVHFASQDADCKMDGEDGTSVATQTQMCALLKIVNALASNAKTHIRYHNIRLMRVLRDTLGNNEHIVLLNYNLPGKYERHDDDKQLPSVDDDCTAEVWKDLYLRQREKYKLLKAKLKSLDFWSSAEEEVILNECSSGIELSKRKSTQDNACMKITDEIAQLYKQLDMKNLELERNYELSQQIEQRCHLQADKLQNALNEQLKLQCELEHIKQQVITTIEEILEVQSTIEQLKLSFDHSLSEITKKDKMLDKLNTLLIKTNEEMSVQKATFKDKLSEFSDIFTKLWRQQSEAMLKQEQQRELQLREVFDALCKELRQSHHEQFEKLSADAKQREIELKRLNKQQQDMIFGEPYDIAESKEVTEYESEL